MIPFIEYERLGLGEIKPAKMVILLVDRSTKMVVDDVLIRVGKFVSVVDFVVLETDKVADTASPIPVTLRHPFLATANALINCRNRIM